MDGARLNGKESLLPDQRRRLVSMLLDFRPWLESTPAAAAVSEVQPLPVPYPVIEPGLTERFGMICWNRDYPARLLQPRAPSPVREPGLPR
ncbi:MAG: hypothetical protein IMZ50_11845 [Candidatus Atribacteria bacterium]|nr:hypothetical protein [Candidatus Atribacteria bacterium]